MFFCCCISEPPQPSAVTECAAGFPISRKKKIPPKPQLCFHLSVSVCLRDQCVHSAACSLGGETRNRELHADAHDECCYEKEDVSVQYAVNYGCD